MVIEIKLDEGLARNELSRIAVQIDDLGAGRGHGFDAGAPDAAAAAGHDNALFPHWMDLPDVGVVEGKHPFSGFAPL